MPTQNQLDAASLYGGIMEEIKIRISAIDAGTGGILGPHLHPLIIREHCYLQLRMICELIAIGCLVAHGDIQAPKISKLRKEWSAETIMKELADLHPDFYPMPMRQGRNEMGHLLTGITPSPFPKEELLKVYGRSGDVLHRGNVRNLIERGTVPINFPDITAIAQKIHDLLAVHLVVMMGGATVFVCVLRNKDDNMRAQISIAERGQLTLPKTAPSAGSQ
jgi:hypothetical protein